MMSWLLWLVFAIGAYILWSMFGPLPKEEEVE